MRVQRFIQYGVLGGLVLAGLACAGNSARTEETAVAKDTTAAQDTSAYRAMSRDTTIRDTAVTAVPDSAKWSQTKSNPSEIKPGESTVRVDSTVGMDSTKMTPDQSQPVPANVDTLRTRNDTTK